ncbi:hyaluronan-mediated motility receptor-like [Pomacea canaliculata]|uniref:hyaluronan-mediated motility receptor-like n=1 Tax=Pomacea canaliculata TaxID=400727 RepID=UPI000D726486|nr:hyaluronan-mediated motility receptor-like [Pomacea canaliculata]
MTKELVTQDRHYEVLVQIVFSCQSSIPYALDLVVRLLETQVVNHQQQGEDDYFYQCQTEKEFTETQSEGAKEDDPALSLTSSPCGSRSDYSDAGKRQEKRSGLRRVLHVMGEQDRELRQLREKCQNLEGQLNNADVAHAGTLEAETKEAKSQLMFDSIRSLKEEAYSESEVMKQQLFEELAENALLKEHIEQLEQENKLLNETIQSLTVKHKVLEEKLTSQEVKEHNLQTLQDELACTKLTNKDLIQSLTQLKELEVLSHAKLDLEAAIKSFMVDLHAVQQREEGVQSQVLHFQTQVQQLQVTEQALKMQLEQQGTLADQEQNKLKDKLKRLKGQEDEFQSALSNSDELAQKYKKQFLQQTEKFSELENEMKDMEAEKTVLQSQIEDILTENCRIVVNMEGQLERMREAALEECSGFEMSEKIQQLEETETPLKEQEDWKSKYDECVEAFMEQFDAFAAERELLLGQRRQDEAEVTKRMEKCAKLLGHQNHHQKIQYMNEMKYEFMKCRKENEELKWKVAKQNKTIQKIERLLQILEDTKLVDALHLRKDQQPLRSPLRQVSFLLLDRIQFEDLLSNS